jgi:hypothetical protein
MDKMGLSERGLFSDITNTIFGPGLPLRHVPPIFLKEDNAHVLAFHSTNPSGLDSDRVSQKISRHFMRREQLACIFYVETLYNKK